MAMALKVLFSELLLWYIGVAIPTYVRNCYADAAWHVDSANTLTNAKRLNGFLRVIGGRKEQMVESGVYPGDTNTPDVLPNSLYSVNLGDLLAGDTFRIVTEERKKEIRRKIHSDGHYIVYPETIQGQNDLNADMRRRTRAVRCWRIVIVPFPNNSFSAQSELAKESRF